MVCQGSQGLSCKKRPAIAFYGFRGGPGGLSKVMLNLINGSAEEGLSVDLLLHSDVPETKALFPGVRIIHLGDPLGIGRIFALARYLASERPVVLLSNREWGNRNAAVARLLFRVPTRLVFRVGNPLTATMDKRGILKGGMRRLSVRMAYQRADLVIANSRRIAEEVLALTSVESARIVQIPNPTVGQDLLKKASGPVSHPWFAQGSPPVVVACGRLARQKDFPTLVRAFAILRHGYSVNARLLIIGEGKERERLKELARSLGVADALDMPGYLDNPFPFMARSSLFVLSSAWEGSPNVLIEALALGRPVVATDCPSGPREILQDGLYGRLVPVGDHEALARAMRETIAAPLPPEILKKAAEPFDAQRCTRKYLRAMGLAH